VQNTRGAELHDGLDCSRIERVFQKGTDPSVDSYSAFFDNAHRRATGLGDYLRDKGVTTVYLMGLATDYCVKYSSIDALDLGFKVVVIGDGCRGIDAEPGDIEKAISEIVRRGATLVNSRRLLAEPRQARGG
jgi:nicotinamidase/pyrazinamidase